MAGIDSFNEFLWIVPLSFGFFLWKGSRQLGELLLPYSATRLSDFCNCPLLLFQFTLACIKMGRTELAQKAVDLAEKRLSADQWPEYYDTKSGRFIGKQSRLFQTWTIAGYLTSKMLLENPEKASLLLWEEDYELLETCVCALTKTGRKKCSRLAAKSQVAV